MRLPASTASRRAPPGRGQKETPSPVHAYARDRDIPVRTPESLKSPDDQAAFADVGAEAAVVIAYGLILPRPILTAPRLGCINIHASLLPRWRGAAPIQRAILAGDAETGVTIMQMDEGLDTGDMLLAEAVEITAQTTAESLHDDLAALGARLIVDALSGLESGTLQPTPQPETGATYAKKLSRDEGGLDWRKNADELERQVRAFAPWPGAWFEVDGQRIKVLAAEVGPAPTRDSGPAPGTILDDRLTVACGAGAFRPVRLQRPGRAAADVDAFLRGFPVPKSTVLSPGQTPP